MPQPQQRVGFGCESIVDSYIDITSPEIISKALKSDITPKLHF